MSSIAICLFLSHKTSKQNGELRRSRSLLIIPKVPFGGACSKLGISTKKENFVIMFYGFVEQKVAYWWGEFITNTKLPLWGTFRNENKSAIILLFCFVFFNLDDKRHVSHLCQHLHRQLLRRKGRKIDVLWDIDGVERSHF